MENEYRVIPGYIGYAVTKDGVVKSIERDLILKQYVLDGYFIVDTFRKAATETLPVHRAVALAWVKNPDPMMFTIVNHADGNRQNNWWENLEWTDYSGNNYHAVNNGLRVDNIPCEVRDFATGEVYQFSSMAQASIFMGLRKDTSIHQLYPKQFGRLIQDRYEFRFKDEPKPWFYENRTERVPPSRFMVVATAPDGTVKETYSNRAMLKDYQLYDSPWGKNMPGLVRYARESHPEYTFVLRDGYDEARLRVHRQTKPSETISMRAIKSDKQLDFTSLTECANHFNVDRSVIMSRLNSAKDLDGWTFISLPL